LSGNRVCQKGISYISEEMNLFVNMSVHENLLMGAYTVKDKSYVKKRIGFVYELFPRLEERRNQLAGTMSGGERKMLGIARGLMPGPKLVLVDEPSFGLAPNLTQDVFAALTRLNEDGLTILVVEQNVTKVLQFTQRGYVLEQGRIELEGISQDLADDPHVRKVFLGV
jgi:branched-chain amino acid transport system ATP-binding protein